MATHKLIVRSLFDQHGLHPHGEVGGHIEIEQLSIHISIHDGQQIEGDRSDDTEIAIIPKKIFTLFEDLFVMIPVNRFRFLIVWQQTVPAIGIRIIIHDIDIGTQIILIMAVVPRNGVSKSHETAVKNGQLPVIPVVNLPQSGENGRIDDGFAGRGLKNSLRCKKRGGTIEAQTVRQLLFSARIPGAFLRSGRQPKRIGSGNDHGIECVERPLIG